MSVPKQADMPRGRRYYPRCLPHIKNTDHGQRCAYKWQTIFAAVARRPTSPKTAARPSSPSHPARHSRDYVTRKRTNEWEARPARAIAPPAANLSGARRGVECRASGCRSVHKNNRSTDRLDRKRDSYSRPTGCRQEGGGSFLRP